MDRRFSHNLINSSPRLLSHLTPKMDTNMKYEKMNARQLRAELAKRGLLETSLKNKAEYLQKLLEDDKKLLMEGASKATTKEQPLSPIRRVAESKSILSCTLSL